jgi:6-phosphogluconolactonase
MKSLCIYPDADHLAAATAEQFICLAVRAIARRGRFSAALAGGTTLRKTYALLASKAYSDRLAWEYVHIFWADERCVPPEHGGSHFCMAQQALLRHVPLPVDNIHRIHGELDPKKAARDYERNLQLFFIAENKRRGVTPGEFVPSFDLVLLGMGTDGHTASLFPGTAALRARRRWIIAHYVERLGCWRITMTPVIINEARQVIFLVSGHSKATLLHQILREPRTNNRLPAQLIELQNGGTTWMVDQAAASLL